MGLFDIFKKKHDKNSDTSSENKASDINRKNIPSDIIDDAQQLDASESYIELCRNKFFKDYPEMPFISKDRELYTNWLEQVEVFPGSLIKPDKMIRFPDGLLPGHVYLLYWLSKHNASRIPVYFEYDYGICVIKEKVFLREQGYLGSDDILTLKGLNVITAHNEVIAERKRKLDRTSALEKMEQKEKKTRLDKALENNLKGIQLESTGDTEEAIRLYKQNVAMRFDGNHPYDRLAIYYRKQKDYDSEIKVLETAIDVFTNDVAKNRPDREKKLSRFKERLKKAKELKAKG